MVKKKDHEEPSGGWGACFQFQGLWPCTVGLSRRPRVGRTGGWELNQSPVTWGGCCFSLAECAVCSPPGPVPIFALQMIDQGWPLPPSFPQLGWWRGTSQRKVSLCPWLCWKSFVRGWRKGLLPTSATVLATCLHSTAPRPDPREYCGCALGGHWRFSWCACKNIWTLGDEEKTASLTVVPVGWSFSLPPCILCVTCSCECDLTWVPGLSIHRYILGQSCEARCLAGYWDHLGALKTLQDWSGHGGFVNTLLPSLMA